MKAEEGFQFETFEAGDPWKTDAALRLALLRLCDGGHLRREQIRTAFDDLSRFGERVGQYAEIGAKLNGPAHEPTLEQYDAWGRRVDRLVVAEGWRQLKQVAAREGIVANSYGPAREKYGKL
jgi:hypothetical protein